MGTNCLFLGTREDTNFLPHLKGLFNGLTTFIITEPLNLLTHLEIYCKRNNITKVVSTNTHILQKLLELQGNIKDSPSLSNYAGSVFEYRNLEIVFINPLSQLMTVPYGKFITARYISKITTPSKWPESTSFSWNLIDVRNVQEIYNELCDAYAIACDIETFKNPLSIRCIGYTGVFLSKEGEITTKSYVLPIDSMWALAWMRKINDIPAQKIFQNGKYDNAYLLRYNAPVRNWLWDTANLFHSYYSELPKDLAFLNAFFLRKVVYWKDLAETHDLHEYYKYNALDTWATANVWIQQLLQLPNWARKNYTLEFPLVYPCLLSEMTGVLRDQERLISARNEIDTHEKEMLGSLRKMIGVPGFNPGSPVQVVKLLATLGCKDLTSSGAKEIAKAKFRHPLNARILSMVSVSKEDPEPSIRGLRKLATSYLRTNLDAVPSGIHKGEGGAKEYKSTWLYSLSPHGTDTGRLASGEHPFWCGMNIQNVPTGKGIIVKSTVRAPEGFYIGECDLEQAESRDTAHIAGDENLIAAVTGPRDFHSVNCSAFFGVPYDSIYDDSLGKTLDKMLRDLAKRVNHGANYNMGAGTLVDTMGFKYIYKAKELLKLPYTEPKDIGTYLLAQFHRTYPAIKEKYYASVINEVGLTSKLVSRAFHHTAYNVSHYDVKEYIEEGDWTRYCFGKPDKNKLDLNSLVAHCPQSLNARTLNEGYMRVFYEIALPNPFDFRMHSQIHDSTFFAYSEEGLRKDLPGAVRKAMEIPVTVRDVSGNYRTFVVPASLKLGKKNKTTGEFVRAIYWDETE